MITYAQSAKDWPPKFPVGYLTAVSVAAPPTPPLSVSAFAQGEPAAGGNDAVPVPPRRSQRRTGQRRRPLSSQITILVVDDEAPVRETLVEALSMQGYSVITAASVEQAEAIKTRLSIEGIHLLLTDVNLLPGARARPGYALAQRWHAMHPELPIILMSGDPSNEDLPEVRDGSLGFLLKPFRIDVLIEAVQRALGR